MGAASVPTCLGGDWEERAETEVHEVAALFGVLCIYCLNESASTPAVILISPGLT